MQIYVKIYESTKSNKYPVYCFKTEVITPYISLIVNRAATHTAKLTIYE
jgi:hypothetical protein